MFAESYGVTALIGNTNGATLEGNDGNNQALRFHGEKLSRNAPLTISAQKHYGYLYPGHLRLEPCHTLDYAANIPDIYKAALKEMGCRPMAFKANIDNLNQIQEAALLANGIGLVRSEHLAFADETQLDSLRKIFSGADSGGMAIKLFYYRQYSQYKKLFDHLHKELTARKACIEYPVCIRLLDAPPDEFLSVEELKKLYEITPAQDQRGVQMGLRNPNLYKKQLKAIFYAYAHYLNTHKQPAGTPTLKLEVMVPTIRSYDELTIAKEMTENAARVCNVPNEKFRFGIMVETLDATRNIEVMAPNVDFFSFGSNDLTSEILGIPRSANITARSKNYDNKTVDPFRTLHENVAQIIIQTAQMARTANSRLKIGLCGAHAADLDSLKALRPAELDYISLPPTRRNHMALSADWGIYDSGERPNSDSRKQQLAF